MANPYKVVTFRIEPLVPWREVAIAELAELGYDSFEETPDGLVAYILPEAFDPESIKTTTPFLVDGVTVSFTISTLEPKNWNAEWESQFDPIDVDGRLRIRAPFHAAQSEVPEVIIQPQMSFGTGHHPTTHLMAQAVLDRDMQGLEVLDMGTGTGVLAILAKQHGATRVQAIDIDEWSVENTKENAERNGVEDVDILLGESDQISGQFDLILANINRNILLDQMATYAAHLKPDGTLLLSGFYPEDIDALQKCAAPEGLQFTGKEERQGWCRLELTKG